MSVITKGRIFVDGEQLTAEKLNVLVDDASFDDSTAVDNSTTRVNASGAITVKPQGIDSTELAVGAVTTAKIEDDAVTPDKLSAGAPTWDANTGDVDIDGIITTPNGVLSTDSTTIGTDSTASNPVAGFALYHSITDRSIARLHVSGFDSVVTFNLNRSALTDRRRIVDFRHQGTQVGKIEVDGSSTAYLTSSDYRLKDDIVEMEGSIDRLKELKPYNFRWKGSDRRVDGFIAHEAQEVIPDAISGAKDAIDEQGNPDYQGIDQAKFVPLLTKALQEAVAKIESLETRVAALES
jgi:hypothetical protein